MIPRFAAGGNLVPAPLTDVELLRRQIDTLTRQLVTAKDAAAAARRQLGAAEEQIRALTITRAGDGTDEIARLRATLLDYQDQIDTCRELHGANTRSNTPATNHGASA